MAEKYALISVSDKRGIVDFARRIAEAGFSIISTGGTAQSLIGAGLEVLEVSEVTGFPEILGGRVKTLHPMVHAALLARRQDSVHQQTLAEHNVPDIQLVVVNLYPFGDVVAREGVSVEEAVENIDIGGPTMLRAAAKNHESITVVCDREDYARVGDALVAGQVDLDFRRQMALKAFRHTAAYDAAITAYFDAQWGGALDGAPESADGVSARNDTQNTVPGVVRLTLRQVQGLRYGENPHQAAGLYARVEADGTAEATLGGVEVLHGKALSYNNIVDLDAALELVREFDHPACAIIKHTNPAGCALGADAGEAYERALECDPTSAFGGIVALNARVDAALAQRMNEHFFEIIVAPDFDDTALEVLQQKKNLRILRVPETLDGPAQTIRATALGYLVQQADPRIASILHAGRAGLTIPTKRQPGEAEIAAMDFAWKVCKHVKSNAIVLGQGTQVVGVGAGQMSRVDSVELAVKKARLDLAGAVLASDAFFPFRDGVDAAAAAGVRAIIQPGGSMRDAEVIEACDAHGIAMIFAGDRHFRH